MTKVNKQKRANEPAWEPIEKLAILSALERKVLWLSSWMIHNANHIRESRDGLKVGGHQASCASVTTLMTALYLDVLRPQDRVAVKPHAAPVFHAIQYLLGRQTRANIERLRSFGGAQAYPSRTKDSDDVDISTGSVGLGAAHTLFSAIARDYVSSRDPAGACVDAGRMVAIVGDAELDEGNIYEALLEGWKKNVRNIWWVIDYNRQSLDSVITDRLFGQIDRLFESMGWRVVTMKYGKSLERAFSLPGGEALREWIDSCPNSLYAALTYKGGRAWREHLQQDIGNVPGICELLGSHDDDGLQELMTNLAGNDLESCLDAFHAPDDGSPTCFISYTVKGHGLPFAGHKDNHAGLMSVEQMEALRIRMGVETGAEWDRYSGLGMEPSVLARYLENVPFAQVYPRRYQAARVTVPGRLEIDVRPRMSTQEGFGQILNRLGRSDSELADRIVTVSPDVAVSTSLGPWVNQRGIFSETEQADIFAEEHVVSAQKWKMSPSGQHVELGIAETNLFLQLSALGLSGSMFGFRLLPVGTVYDPFIRRGLDAMHYGCYQDARFMLVATPSGISLAPEGGAHQSAETPLITLAQPGMAAFEPAFVDELAEIMRWGFEYMQAEDGGSVALRLSTRIIPQPQREFDLEAREAIVAGGYWLDPPGPSSQLAIVCMGAVVPEAIEAVRSLREDVPGTGLLAVTSPERLYADWMETRQLRRSGRKGIAAHVERLLGHLDRHCALVTVCDGHSATLAWLGSVAGQPIYPLGVDRFGQSGDVADLYAYYGIDTDAISGRSRSRPCPALA